MQDNTVARLPSTRVQTPLSPLYFKCTVLRESLTEDSQNIPGATLKKRRSWVISIYLCVELTMEEPGDQHEYEVVSA